MAAIHHITMGKMGWLLVPAKSALQLLLRGHSLIKISQVIPNLWACKVVKSIFGQHWHAGAAFLTVIKQHTV